MKNIWWYSLADDKFGPFSEEHLVELVGARKIDGSTLAWKKGSQAWEPIANIKELLSVHNALGALDEPPPLPTLLAPQVANPVELPATAISSTAPMETAEPEDSAAQAPRVHRAPRLDEAFAAQASLAKHGKITVPIIAALTFLGGALGIFGVIGLIGYWMAYLKNKGRLEELEKELFVRSRQDGVLHDISDLNRLWFKFGPFIAFALSIISVAFLLLKWFISLCANDR